MSLWTRIYLFTRIGFGGSSLLILLTAIVFWVLYNSTYPIHSLSDHHLHIKYLLSISVQELIVMSQVRAISVVIVVVGVVMVAYVDAVPEVGAFVVVVVVGG